MATRPFKKKNNKIVIILKCSIDDKTWRTTPGSGVNLWVWIQAKSSGKYPYWAPTIQYLAASNRIALALPKALIEIRIGKTRTAGPNTTSPHVYVEVIH